MRRNAVRATADSKPGRPLVTGIRVVNAETGGRPGLLSAVARTALRLIDGLLGYLVALIVVVNSDRRRWLGDMAAKTLVVRA